MGYKMIKNTLKKNIKKQNTQLKKQVKQLKKQNTQLKQLKHKIILNSILTKRNLANISYIMESWLYLARLQGIHHDTPNITINIGRDNNGNINIGGQKNEV